MLCRWRFPAVMEGWVNKKAMTARKNKWEKRFMVLKGDVLAYYGSEKDARAGKSAKKALTLNHSSKVKRPAYFHADEFEVTVGVGKVLYAVSELKEDSERWVAAINAVIAAKHAEAAASELGRNCRFGYLAFSRQTGCIWACGCKLMDKTDDCCGFQAVLSQLQSRKRRSGTWKMKKLCCKP
jgi:PH domain